MATDNLKAEAREKWVALYKQIGNVSVAARRCGIARSTLQRWIRRYGRVCPSMRRWSYGHTGLLFSAVEKSEFFLRLEVFEAKSSILYSKAALPVRQKSIFQSKCFGNDLNVRQLFRPVRKRRFLQGKLRAYLRNKSNYEGMCSVIAGKESDTSA